MDFILRQGVDRIVVMNEGEVLMTDHLMTLKEVKKLYQHIWAPLKIGNGKN